MLNYILLAIAVLAVSSAAIFVVLASVPGIVAAFWRLTFSLPLVYLIYRPKPEFSRLSIFAGFSLAMHFALWMESLFHASVAVSTTVVCTHSIFSGIFASLYGEKLSPRQLIGVLIALTGIYFLSGADPSAEAIGVAMALLAAIFGGAYFASGRFARTRDFGSYVFSTYASAAAVSLAICVLFGAELFNYPPHSWVFLLLLAAIPMLLGHTLLNYLLRSMEVVPVTASVMFEAVGATLLAAAILGQRLPADAYLHMLVVLAGIAIAQRR